MTFVPRCATCRREFSVLDLRDGLCFRCRVRTLGFTFKGAHVGRRGWNEDTVMGMKKEIYDGARETGTDITRV